MSGPNQFAACAQGSSIPPAQPVISDADARMVFLSAMEAQGIKPLDNIAPRLGSGLIRFRCEGDKPGKANGWAILHLDGIPAGAFGNYRMGLSDKWRANGPTERLTPTQRRERASAYRAEQEARAAERLRLQIDAAGRCETRWQQAGPVDPTHPYLVQKGLTGEGLRQSGAWLLVPMRDDQGKLWNIQRIAPDGMKLFSKAARQQGLFCLIGEPAKRLCIGEGYATCAVVRRASGDAVAAAFSSANMMATALACRVLFPDRDIVVLADDDPQLIENPHVRKNLGVVAATEAAAAVGGWVAMPPREVA